MEPKYTHATVEQEVRELWEREQVFAYDNTKKPIFSIDTPPPTVSGSIHVGHVLSYTQTDIIARFNRMKGFNVFYPFGYDDNGLATERFVEKKRAVSAFNMGRTEFIKLCLQETALAEHQFKEIWQAVGLSVDWNLSYSTIAPNIRKLSQESFILLYNKGLIYRKNEPALYCTACRTSVAQAELDDKTVDTQFYDIAFSISDGQKLAISTTRPELLAACVALLYHPSDTRYKNLNKQKAIVPLYDHQVSVIADELVDPQKGTGLVMCCTFGDKNDIYWYQTHKLPYREAINKDGKWTTLAGSLVGLKVHEARKKIIHELTELGVLINQRPTSHSVNVHERCKHEIEYVILTQWFLRILDHKKEFLALADQIDWFPTFMKTRYVNWVENLNWDWCLSRQRFYGIPFPAWHCQTCNRPIIAHIDQLPIDPQETAYDKPCPYCGASTVVADTDIMDTWNTSSITPYICSSLANKNTESIFDNQHTQQFLPMAMRPQAHDIIRTWAFYTIVKTWFHQQTIPWKSIVISGHTLSTKAEKISKSQNNAPTQPENLLKQWSADAIRFWTASATLGTDVTFSENQFKIGQRLVTKLWNACRFISEHTKEVDLKNQPTKLGIVNEWILHKATFTFELYEKELNKNEFSLALTHLEYFFWHDFCDNYLEIIKDQLFKPELYNPNDIKATRWTLSWMGIRLLQLYAPFVPFVTEKIYQELYRPIFKTASIHRTLLSEIQKTYNFETSMPTMATMLDIIFQVRKLKTEHKLSLGTPLKELVLYTSQPETHLIIEKEQYILKGVCKTEKIRFTEQPTTNNLIIQDTIYTAYIKLN